MKLWIYTLIVGLALAANPIFDNASAQPHYRVTHPGGSGK